MIRALQIDVLVDPTGHMASNRMLVFARKPAPVQVAFPGYPGSCGLKTMDYFVTDVLQNPPGSDATGYAEKWLYVNPTSRCYQRDGNEPEISPLPSDERGYITFGCLNRPIKVTGAMAEVWVRILRRIPASRLMLLGSAGATGRSRALLKGFADRGIAPERITFVGTRKRNDYLRLFHGIDIALDTFPYAGCTTTCDALLMGVPTISRIGETYASRMGLSILTQVGLSGLAVATVIAYENVACELAQNVHRLRHLRRSLRGRFVRSPLIVPDAMARAWESVIRAAWRNGCDRM